MFCPELLIYCHNESVTNLLIYTMERYTIWTSVFLFFFYFIYLFIFVIIIIIITRGWLIMEKNVEDNFQ